MLYSTVTMSSPLIVAPFLHGEGGAFAPEPFDPIDAAIDEALFRQDTELGVYAERVLAHYEDTEDTALLEAAKPYYGAIAATAIRGIGLVRGFENRPGALAAPRGSVARASAVLQGVLDNETVRRWEMMDGTYADATDAPMKRFSPVRRGGPMALAAKQAHCVVRHDEESDVTYVKSDVCSLEDIEQTLERHQKDSQVSWIKPALMATVAELTESRILAESAILQDTIEQRNQRQPFLRRLGRVIHLGT